MSDFALIEFTMSVKKRVSLVVLQDNPGFD
jgi:hypothetical protein